MLCQTCPIRNICKEACENLEKDLRKFNFPQYEALISDFATYLENQNSEVAFGDSAEKNIKKVEKLLDLLTPNEKKCIKEFFLEGKSQREIAQEFQLTQSGVSRLITSSFHKIRQNYSSPSTIYIGTLAA